MGAIKTEWSYILLIMISKRLLAKYSPTFSASHETPNFDKMKDQMKQAHVILVRHGTTP